MPAREVTTNGGTLDPVKDPQNEGAEDADITPEATGLLT
jgi:hypothetical protein